MTFQLLSNISVSQLDFYNNCSAVGRYFHALSDNPDQLWHAEADLWIQALPPALRTVTVSEVMYWKEHVLKDTAPRNSSLASGNFEPGSCQMDICRYTLEAIEGNPDVGGIGMVISFGIQMGIFIYLQLGIMVLGWGASSRDPNWKDRHITVIYNTLLTFWDTQLVLAISVGFAIIRTTQNNESFYDFIIALWSGIYVVAGIFPTLITIWPNMRRRKFNCVAALFAIAVDMSAYYQGVNNNDYFADYERPQNIPIGPSTRTSRERWCFMTPEFDMGVSLDPRHSVWHLLFVGAALGSVIFAVMGTAACCCFFTLCKERGAGGRPGFLRKSLFRTAAIYAIGILIALFSVLVRIKTRVAGWAAPSYTENEWGFGQVVAVFLWVPTLVEYVYLTMFDPVEGLNGRIAKPLVVGIPEGYQHLQGKRSRRESFELENSNGASV